jgi:Tripartite tricarboxylate transporter TctA family/Pentapeptide repeats (8 copies)
VIAPESANNGVTAGTLVPLLTLGIPGGSTAAVMLIVLQYHGVPLGPKLFIESPEMAYVVIMAILDSANLRDAHLEGASLRDTDLTRQQLDVAFSDEQTKLPPHIERRP